MAVNGITPAVEAYTAYTGSYHAEDARTKDVEGQKPDTEQTKVGETTKETEAKEEQAAIYEPGTSQESASSKAPTTGGYKNMSAVDRQAVIARMKADLEEQSKRLSDIVSKMIAEQANADHNLTGIYQALARGEFTVDDATKAQAEADIAEDGYFGVNQTSDRILDFAKALSGDDPAKADELLNAFKKGYEMARKTWGGELPEICQKTYDAVVQKFDDWKAQTEA